jgi:peptide/nickel transport system substrate-binding protein
MRRPLLAAALVPLLACAGGEQPAPPAPARGGTIVLGLTTDVDAWNEYLSAQAAAVAIHKRIWLRLAQETIDAARGPEAFEPLLATAWRFSPDRRELRFTLRDATWSDGAPVTADDVVFTWRAQTSPAVAWVGASNKQRIVAVEAVGPREVLFRFDRAYPEQLADAVDGGIVPEHVFGAVPFDAWRAHDWSVSVVGSGPFLLERHAPGEEIVLGRNGRYFDAGRPRADRVVARIVPDAAALLAQFRAGGLDWVEGVAPSEAKGLAALPGVRVAAVDLPGFDYVGWNGSKAPFDDREVRLALTLAIDRRALVEDLLFGHGRVSAGPVPSFWWNADPALEPLPFDPPRARRILESRGYRPDRPLTVEMMTNVGNRLREGVLVKIQDQLSRAGVRVVPRPLEMKALREIAASGRYDAFVGGWRFGAKIDLGSLFGSASVPPAGSNVVFYRSPEMDRLIEGLGSGTDAAGLRDVYAAIGRRLRDDQPYTFLYELRRLVATGPRLSGVRIDVPTDTLAHLDEVEVRDSR